MNAPIVENVKYDIQGSYDGQWWAKRNDYSYASVDHAQRVAAELAAAETYGQQFRVIEVRETWTVVAPTTEVRKADVETVPAPAQEDEKPDVSEPVWQAASFDAFAVGDRIRFQTLDNGFGGSGDFVLRTGTVTAVTARTLRVQCDGSGSWLGDRAVITRAGWYRRDPQRAVVAEAEKAPAVTETPAAPRYVVASYNRKKSFAVYDTATELDVAHYTSRYAAQYKADQLNEDMTELETRVTQSAEESQTADPKCIHGNTARPDVTGDPIAECAKRSNAEWGAFSDEGCYYAYDCAVDVANESAKQNEEAEADADDPVSTWGEMCRDHRAQEQPKDGCEECNAETDEDEG